METTSPLGETIESLLAPLEQTFKAFASQSGSLTEFSRHAERAIEVLRDIGEEEAAVLVDTLSSLTEVAEGITSNQDSDPADGDEIVQFVEDGLQGLRDGLMGDSPGGFHDRVTAATERWGEHLQLLTDSPGLSGAPAALSGEWDGSEPDGAASQVDLILSTLASAPDASSTPVPRCETEESTADGPPTHSVSPVNDTEHPTLDSELLEAYLEDAVQCLTSMERSLLDFESDPNSDTPIEQLCRELHTLKGASASVGFSELAAQLHEVEEELEGHRADTGSVPVDRVMACVDAVRTQISSLQTSSELAVGPESQTGTRPAVEFGDSGADSTDFVRVRTSQLDTLMDLLADVVMWRTRREKSLSELDSCDRELSRCHYRVQAIADRLHDHHSGRPSAGTSTETPQSGRVAELTGDMREIMQQLRKTRRELAEENRAISQFVHEFRQTLVQVRRVPLSGLFQRLRRAVRDAARVEGKDVDLQIHGDHLGLERSLQERLYEPLLHLVRNAVSHGIESPDVRIKSGKSPCGTVTLDAYGSPHVLIIEVRDDGRGLDFDAIRRRGVERGMIYADRPVSEAELARLIFRPGFSTRDVTNAVAGRGVGMNVVEEALDRCHCHIETESTSGRGTRFRITIPLRSVVEHTLLFRSGGQAFALPMQFVKSASQNRTGECPGDQSPAAVPLDRLLGDTRQPSGQVQGLIEIAERLTSRSDAGTAEKLAREHRLRIGVDEILGPEEVVVRPLPPLLRRHPHLCGLTVSGTGEVVLLLDGRRLLNDSASEIDRRSEPSVQPMAASGDRHDLSGRRVLVADDSLSARRRLVQIMRDLGLDIVEVGDGAEALERLRDEEYDAVFSDLEMPNLGGFDLLEELKCLAPKAPPCVIVTTRSESDTRDRAASLGAAGFLAKPVDTDSVTDMVARLGLRPVFRNRGEN